MTVAGLTVAAPGAWFGIHNDPSQAGKLESEFSYYPLEWTSPFVDRRRKVGWDMYGLLGIGKAVALHSGLVTSARHLGMAEQLKLIMQSRRRAAPRTDMWGLF